MDKTDFWIQSAEAMELTIEGKRLIAQELAAFASNLLERTKRAWGAMLGGENRHLPPI